MKLENQKLNLKYSTHKTKVSELHGSFAIISICLATRVEWILIF